MDIQKETVCDTYVYICVCSMYLCTYVYEFNDQIYIINYSLLYKHSCIS